MMYNLVQKANTERDLVIIIHGCKKTGKRQLRNQLITGLFDYLDKGIQDGNIEKNDFKVSTMVKEYDTKWSDLQLKKNSFSKQLQALASSVIAKVDKKFIKEKIEGCPSKCAFFELSKMLCNREELNTEILKSSVSKVNGIYFITYNKLLKIPNCVKKSDFIKNLLKECVRENANTLIEDPIRRLLTNFDTAYTNVICTLNPFSRSSRQSYEQVKSLPLVGEVSIQP